MTSHCKLCEGKRQGPTVYAGPALGLVHVSCFCAMDRRSEALEHGGDSLPAVPGRAAP